MQGEWGQQKCKHYMTFDRWSPLVDTPEDMQCRIVAMLPGGPVATMLAGHPVVMKVCVCAQQLFIKQMVSIVTCICAA
jgi:hypothetical protein